jgi:hypothetical protein
VIYAIFSPGTALAYIPVMVMQVEQTTSSLGKMVSISPRQRLALQRLLVGEQRKCSATALNALERRGWVHGPTTGYQLTDVGWRIAERSAQAPPGRRIEFYLS